jgi:hypothetical protein
MLSRQMGNSALFDAEIMRDAGDFIISINNIKG